MWKRNSVTKPEPRNSFLLSGETRRCNLTSIWQLAWTSERELFFKLKFNNLPDVTTSPVSPLSKTEDRQWETIILLVIKTQNLFYKYGNLRFITF